jgi:hypothetical protein
MLDETGEITDRNDSNHGSKEGCRTELRFWFIFYI